MKIYTEESSYRVLAARVLAEPGFADHMAGSSDEAVRAALNWLNTRVQLPAVLERWRRQGRNRIQIVRPGSAAGGSKSPSDRKKSKRKAQTASRRRNR
ncbi:hypothetical protein NOVA_29065 [Nocardia nova]|uniref:hypothetical protein n=1 Tax=Nocardia nova TaxID=37330 RepID=UPI001C473812|nr:hypothetical protein [Nocardia nova]MBV7706843.1 hypothetical protein [Nocardia nova]